MSFNRTFQLCLCTVSFNCVNCAFVERAYLFPRTGKRIAVVVVIGVVVVVGAVVITVVVLLQVGGPTLAHQEFTPLRDIRDDGATLIQHTNATQLEAEREPFSLLNNILHPQSPELIRINPQTRASANVVICPHLDWRRCFAFYSSRRCRRRSVIEYDGDAADKLANRRIFPREETRMARKYAPQALSAAARSTHVIAAVSTSI